MPERGLVALSVVEDFDVFEQVEPCRGPGREPERATDPAYLAFQSRPERFHGGVVVAVSRRAEADLEAGQCRGGTEVERRVLGGFKWSSQHFDRGGVDGQASGVDEGVDGQVADEVAGCAVGS